MNYILTTLLIHSSLGLIIKQEEGWVVCRVFKKRATATMRKVNEDESPCWYEDQITFMPLMESPNPSPNPNNNMPYQYLPNYPCKKELDLQNYHAIHHLPLLVSPKMLQQSGHGYGLNMNSTSINLLQSSSVTQEEQIVQQHSGDDPNLNSYINNEQEVTDWRVLDKFVASQLSQEDISDKEGNNNCAEAGNNMFQASEETTSAAARNLMNMKETEQENATASNSSQIDLWK